MLLLVEVISTADLLYVVCQRMYSGGYLRSFHAFSAVGYGKRGVWKMKNKRTCLVFTIKITDSFNNTFTYNINENLMS